MDGAVGAVWAAGGQPRVLFGFSIPAGKITAIEILADPARLSRATIALLDG